MTNETKQTAVEWYGMEIGKLFAQYHGKKICIGEFHRKRFELEDKAKAMHKTEHFNTWWHGISENEPITFEQYYNETYGGNK